MGPIKKKSSAKAAFVLLCAVLVVFLALIPVSSWVVRNRHVYNGAEMQINDNVVSSVAFTAYKYFIEENEAHVVTGNDIFLPKYDSVFIERNEKIALIYKAPISGSTIDAGDPFTITLDLQDHSSVTGISDNNYLDGDKTPGSSDTAIADYVSNVCYVRIGIIPTLQENSSITEPTAVYNTALEWFADSSNNAEKHTFFEGTNNAKTSSITFTFSNYSPPPNGGRVLDVWIEIGYEPARVSAMTESRGLLIDSSSILDNTISIGSDLGHFIFLAAGT